MEGDYTWLKVRIERQKKWRRQILDFILNLNLQKRKLKWSKTELGGRELN